MIVKNPIIELANSQVELDSFQQLSFAHTNSCYRDVIHAHKSLSMGTIARNLSGQKRKYSHDDDNDESPVKRHKQQGAFDFCQIGEEEEEEEDYEGAKLRVSLKIVRDPTKTAYDVLPSGETIGAFANKHAVARYARKIENKRERAREIRKKKKKNARRNRLSRITK